ncbi:hypothetical protein GCM10010974_10530 [Brevibacterium sediminis]|uniref:Uncharacterized protein n=1 Tax=Brevibacterium sediminis TaxID=1857024 RepID=A0ABQ1LU47_9MICO|nr:hypothetical protein GCM10010974_10530 [Brevibacterium sediminis]
MDTAAAGKEADEPEAATGEQPGEKPGEKLGEKPGEKPRELKADKRARAVAGR